MHLLLFYSDTYRLGDQSSVAPVSAYFWIDHRGFPYVLLFYAGLAGTYRHGDQLSISPVSAYFWLTTVDAPTFCCSMPVRTAMRTDRPLHYFSAYFWIDHRGCPYIV